LNNRFAFLEMEDSTALRDDPEALRARLATDGYLLFRGVIDRERVRQVRRGILGVTQRLGWTEPGDFPMSQRCTVVPLREEDQEFIDGYQEVQKLQTFHELAHDEALVGVMRAALGDTAFPHPLKIARLAFPDHYEASTPPHQDYPNNQGTPQLTAAWVPVSDITPEMGGLAVLAGSHRWGVLPMEGHIGAGNRAAVIPPDMARECRWVTTDFEMGDVLVFPSTTVHASLHNASEFFMRLSVDFRYQLEGQALTPGCLEPHFGRLTWEEVYAGWDSDRYQYYWRDLDYAVEPFEVIRPVDHTDDLQQHDVAEMLQYERRVLERARRRMDTLGRELERRDTRSTTFDVERQIGA
jgi:ectoine hydroxylase-related dioxygenase (phytanoyl-CoA dioxygenase family)